MHLLLKGFEIFKDKSLNWDTESFLSAFLNLIGFPSNSYFEFSDRLQIWNATRMFSDALC